MENSEDTTKDLVAWWDIEKDLESKLQDLGVEYLTDGIYVIGNFRQLQPKQAINVLKRGAKVYVMTAYGSDLVMYFSGTILWQSAQQDRSQLIDPVSLGPIPAGTLVVALNDD